MSLPARSLHNSREFVRLKRGEKCMKINLNDLEGTKLGTIFQLQCVSIYLVNEVDNVAVFPIEAGGRFMNSSIDCAATYLVQGDDLSSEQSPSQSRQSSESLTITSPFGAYSGPTNLPPFRSTTMTVPQMFRRKTGNIRKTIALVSLSASDPNKPTSSKASLCPLNYQVITQLVVAIDVDRCSVSAVSEQIQQQVGFSVILLDSKCFPVMENNTTSVVGFWKSNRKILAASKELHNKLTGSSVDPKHAKNEIDLIRLDDDDDDSRCNTPPSKRKHHDKSTIAGTHSVKLNKVLEGIEFLKKENEILKATCTVFECIICKGVMKSPQFANCCKRIIGCKTCIEHWLDEKLTCPHCSAATVPIAYKDVRGFDDFLHLLNFLSNPIASDASPVTDDQAESDDDDFELPNFRLRSHPS